MTWNRLADELRQLCVVMGAGARRSALPRGLQAVHLEVLRYLRRCNRYSNTPAAIADYLGSTRGTVSQTLKLLEKQGLVRRAADPQDGRVVRLDLSEQGRELLEEQDAAGPVEQGLAALDEVTRHSLRAGVVTLLREAQRVNGGRTFGACHSCRFFRRDGGGDHRCGLTGETLSDDDALRICVEHEPAAESAGGAQNR